MYFNRALFLTLSCASFLSAFSLSAAEVPAPVLVKNISAGAPVPSLVPTQMVDAAGTIFFLGSDPEHGQELWKTDGTEVGTVLVKDLMPGPASPAFGTLTASGAQVFFSASDGVHGWELWRSDGTGEGTRMIADFAAAPEASSSPRWITPYKNGVVFVADADTAGVSLWFTDGSENGTRMLSAMPGYGIPEIVAIDGPFTIIGDTFYFVMYDTARGLELWKSNGTAAGTVLVKDIVPGADGSSPYSLFAVGNTLYFSAITPGQGAELWKSNGTAAGTVLVKDIEPGPGNSHATALAASGNKLFFSVLGNSLWTSTGTAGSTVRLFDFGANGSSLVQVRAVGGRLLCFVMRPSMGYGYDVVSVNPTLKTAEVLMSIVTSPTSGSPDVSEMVSYGNGVAFMSRSRINDTLTSTLWTCDGLTAPQAVYQSPEPIQPPVATSKGLFFAGSDRGLWKSDGTQAGTVIVKNVPGAEPSSSPRALKTLAGRVYFTTSGQLWASDGTEAGTARIAPGLSFTVSTILAELNGEVYFMADDGTHGTEMWKTDGTEAGTGLIKDIRLGSNGLAIGTATAYNGHLYFACAGSNSDTEVWRTDGTEDGTALFANLNPTSSSQPSFFQVMNGSLYLVAGDVYGRRVLWRSEGLPGGVAPVTSTLRIGSPLVLRQPTPGAALLPDQALLFFFAHDSTNRYGLCYSDGTPEGSVMIHVLAENGAGVEARSLTVFGNRLFFRVKNGEDIRLYSTNGVTMTAVNTPVRLDLISSQSLISDLWVADNKLYFRGSAPGVAGSHGIWFTDANGSPPVQVYSSSTDGAPGILSSQGDKLFFATQNEWRSRFWVTQGQVTNTRRIPGVVSGNDTTFAALGSRVLFPAFSPFYGEELFALEPLPGISVSDVSQGENAAPVPLSSGAVLDAGYRFVSLTMAPAYLRVTNSGFGDLTGLSATVEGEHAGDFTASFQQLPATLASGRGTTLEVRFNPQAAGPRTATLRITSGGATPLTHTLTLTGHGLQSGGAPVVTQDPGSFLVLSGSHITLSGSISLMPPVTHTWRQDGTVVSTSTGNPFLTIPSAQASHVGAYTYSVSTEQGDATTGPGYVAIVTPAPATVISQQSKTLTLTCSAAAPAGTTLTYQWLRDNLPLGDIDRIRGSRSATLTITGCLEADLGAFECVVTLSASGQGAALAPSLSHGITQVSLTDRPRLPLNFTLPDTVVGQEVDLQIPSIYMATAFTAKGLPPGTSLSASGRLTGRPTKMKGVSKTGTSLPYLVTFTASNTLGTSSPLTIPWVIHPALPVGNFDGLLDRLPGGQDLGGRVTLTTLSAGTLSGQLTWGGKIYRFTKILSSVVPSPEDEMAAYKMLTTVEIPQARGLAPWSLEIGEHKQIHEMSLRLMTGTDRVQGYIHPRLVSTTTPMTGFTGSYTMALSALTPAADLPPGSGWITATVAKSGTYTWTGRLADDTAITGSGSLAWSVGGALMMVHAPLYKNTGSLHGLISIQYFGSLEVPSTTTTAGLTWMKRAAPASSKERIYKEGIPLHTLNLEGGLYTTPPKDRTLFSPAVFDDYLGDVHVDFSGAGLSPFVRDISLNTRHVAYLPPVAERPPLKSLTFNATKGTFTGQLSFSDPNPVIPARPYVRNAKFQGVVLPIQKRGAGYFMLNQLPVSEPVPTTLTTSPILSGEVKLTPFPHPMP